MAFDSATPINRRTVAKGIAWSVPAVAVAGAAPAFAASPGFVQFTGNACKEPGNSIPGVPDSKQYYVELVITNQTAVVLNITFDGATVNGSNPINPPGFQATPTGATVPAYTKQTIVVRIGNWGNSANATVVLSYTVNGVSGTATKSFVDTPPLNNQQKCLLVYPSTPVNVPL